MGQGCTLAGVDRLMSEAISCGGGSILLSGRGGGGTFFGRERWLFRVLVSTRVLYGTPLAVRNLDLRLCGCGAGSAVDGGSGNDL